MDKLASFNFNDIELDCEPDAQLCDLISNFEFILTLMSLPNLDRIREPILISVPAYYEIRSPILDSHIH